MNKCIAKKKGDIELKTQYFGKSIITHRSLTNALAQKLGKQHEVQQIYLARGRTLAQREQCVEHQLLLCFPNGHGYFMEMRTQVILHFPSNIFTSVQAFNTGGFKFTTTILPKLSTPKQRSMHMKQFLMRSFHI